MTKLSSLGIYYLKRQMTEFADTICICIVEVAEYGAVDLILSARLWAKAEDGCARKMKESLCHYPVRKGQIYLGVACYAL